MYAKVFNQIFDSSIADDLQLRYFFMDLLILADQNGVVDMTASAIAARTRVPLTDVQKHLAVLEQPDPESRTREHEGKRIARLDTHRSWGWLIINYDRFRMTASEVQRRSQNLIRVNKYRGKASKAAPVTQLSRSCHSLSPLSRQAEAEAEVEAKAEAIKSENNPQPLAPLAESIYEAYPRKAARPVALKAILKALQTTDGATLLAATQTYAAARKGQDSQFTPMPATWFNQQRYSDDPQSWLAPSSVKPKERNERTESLTLTVIR